MRGIRRRGRSGDSHHRVCCADGSCGSRAGEWPELGGVRRDRTGRDPVDVHERARRLARAGGQLRRRRRRDGIRNLGRTRRTSTGGDPGLEQIGTNANCDARGRPTYFAWFEVLPYIAYPITAKVRPAARSPPPSPSTAMRPVAAPDSDARWSVTKNLSSPAPEPRRRSGSSRLPLACDAYACAPKRLANFGSVSITDVVAGTTSDSSALADPSWSISAIRLAPADPTAAPGAVPAPVSADGEAFSVLWAPAG